MSLRLRLHLLAPLLLLLAAFSPTVARADAVDRMDDAGRFFQVTGPAELREADGAVTLAKTGSGDVFARWSLEAPAAMPLSAENDRVELDLAGFPDGGAVQLLVMIDDANGPAGAPVGVVWEERLATTGRRVLPSVRALARANGIANPLSYHLFFRVANDPAGAVTIERIRLSREGDASPADTAGADTAPGTTEAELVFTAEPKQDGISFDRSGAQATEVIVDGRGSPAWVVNDPRPGVAEPWQRAFRLDVTDPGMTDGRRGSVDIELTYRLDAWGAVHVIADTAEGPREVADLWGNSEGRWKTETVRLDGARFGNGLPGGVDLVLAGDNGPLWIKRVRITAYDPAENVNWDRMLSMEEAQPVGPAQRDLFVFERGRPAAVSYRLRNHADVAPPMRWAVRLLDAAGEEAARDGGLFSPAAGGATPLGVSFDTGDLPLGTYTAELSAYLGDAAQPAFRTETLLGVIDGERIGKARPGDFQFGLDPGADTTSDASLAWYRLMGVDLLRFPGGDSGSIDLAPLEAAVSRLEAEGVETCMILDPPGQIQAVTEAERVEQLKTKVVAIEKLARAMRGRITWYELGNEPDLPFFHPGPVEAYLDSFHHMADAVKRGNPDAIVMNGGLCFFGPVGDRRAREIIAGIDVSRLDAWAYHGHGDGVAAERDAWQRQVDAVTDAGKNTLPLFDTETGTSAGSPAGYREQSRTGVEKTVFAMARGMASLMYFRLNMGDEGYSLTNDHVQPRPTVLSYRAMVQRLRHARFARELDAGVAGVEAYLFEETGSDDAPTGRKTLVAWNNDGGEKTISVAMDAAGARVDDATVFDLYGNPSPAASVGVVATLAVGIDAVYLTWTSPGTAADAGTAPPALGPGEADPFLARGENQAAWLVRNDTDATLNATLAVEAIGEPPMTVAGGPRTLSLAPHTSELVTVPVRTDGEPALAAPAWWHVFTGLDARAVDGLAPPAFAEIPDTLPGAGAASIPQRVWAPGGGIDLGPLAGSVIEKTPAVLFASIDAPADTTLAFGASADFWMRWYVNGKKVFDNFDAGNRGGILDQRFELPLKQGRNVIAAHVRSGTAGFRVDFGGPVALATAEAAGLAPDRLEARLLDGDRLLAKQVTPIAFVPALPAFADLPADAPLAGWLTREPVRVAGEAEVENFHEAQPDSSLWYGGEADLSAVVWARRPADAPGFLDLIVAVRDDEAAHCDAPSAGVDEMLQRDALRVTAEGAEGRPLGVAVLAATRSGPVSDLPTGWGPADTEAVDTDGFRWLHRLRVPVGTGGIDRLRVEALDADRGVAKQVLEAASLRIPRQPQP